MPGARDRPRPSLKTVSSTPRHYQTFAALKPPASRGRPPRSDSLFGGGGNNGNGAGAPKPDADPGTPDSSDAHEASPLPKKQLVVLAIVALAEQTAFNSISPYLPDMTSTFPDISSDSEVGLYVGLIASSFALAQFTTNFFWGWLSDSIGRKPVILLGTLLTAACFVAFGFCKTLWQAIVVQICMGLVNGNQGIVSSCLGEITDRSNQSKAFAYLPVVYGIGAVTGPMVGGLLVDRVDPLRSTAVKYPYLLPNLVSAGLLLADLVFAMLFMEESLAEAKNLPPLGKRVGSLFSWMWQFAAGSRTPSYTVAGEEYDSDSSHESAPMLLPGIGTEARQLKTKDVLNRDTFLILLTYFVFQLSNIAYNSLYPIFAQAAEPTGRNLSPEEIGISLAFAGVVCIVFQIGIFTKLKERVGNKVTYRVGLAGFVVSFLLMPWVAYKDGNGDGLALGHGKALCWTELGIVLTIKTVATVGGLTSALLLTLSAAGRALGPFISGALFTAATKVRPKGEAMAFGVFGGVAFCGFVLSFWIRGENLEGDEPKESDDESDESEEESAASSPGHTST